MNVIETRQLEKRFSTVRALDRVSTTLPEGSTTLLRGPNGAGKTTLLRVLAALTRPTRGAVRVLGANPFGADAAAQLDRLGATRGAEARFESLAATFAQATRLEIAFWEMGCAKRHDS